MLTLNDGRDELWQWDTGRTLAVDADCSQVHFSNKVFGRSIDVDVVYGVAIIPDILLQTDKDFNAWAFVGTAENGYTKISKTFKVNRRNKPADYVFTPPEQTTLAELTERLDKIEESQAPDAIKNAVGDYLEKNPVESPVQSVNGKTGTVELTAEDVGAISNETDPTVPAWAKEPKKPAYTASEVGALSAETLPAAINTALAQAKDSGAFDGAPGADGDPGAPGADGYSPTASVTQTDTGVVITITDKAGTTTATLKNGADGQPGTTGATPNIQIGTVETLAAGSPATASMGGTPENPLLNLGIPQGAPGSGSGISVSGATVGQTVRIAAVDDNGVPTAWEPVDFPSGADEPTGVIELLVDHTITAEEASASSITFTKEKWPLIDGQKFVFVRVVKPTGISGWWKLKAGNKVIISFPGSTNISQVGFAMVTNGIWLADTSEGGNMASASNLRPTIWVQYKAYSAIDPSSYDYYDSFTLYSFTTVWPEGTTIEIYGVK